jgi:hypothetical protein
VKAKEQMVGIVGDRRMLISRTIKDLPCIVNFNELVCRLPSSGLLSERQ